MEELKTGCRLCPRGCGAERSAGRAGVCGVSGDEIYVARAALHMWEEPCISGTAGSGAVFFAGCPLHCVYCQNYQISGAQDGRGAQAGNGAQADHSAQDSCGARAGVPVTEERLAEIFLELQEKGAANINLVTPTHYTPQIVRAVRTARARGLRLPIVYNCGGYEKAETVASLAGVVDVYLTDFKYMDARLAARYSHAPDYPDAAKAALREMVRQQENAQFDGDGMMTRGVIVRHLLLPGHVQNAREVVKYVYETYGDQVYLSLMNQYTPFDHVPYPELKRKVTKREYERLLDYALSLGVENAFIQEGDTARESFIPPFDGQGVPAVSDVELRI